MTSKLFVVVGLAVLLCVAPAAIAFGTNCEQGSEPIVQPKGIVQQEMPPNLKVAFFGDQGLNSASVAVLNMIKNWNADMIMHLGDFDYEDNPDAWDAQVTGVLGADYPYFSLIGNHDLRAWTRYSEKLTARFSKIPDLSCEGDIGVKMVCSYKGLLFVLSGVGTLGSGHPEFIRQTFTNYQATWKVCGWHKNQRLYQTGGKIDETGYAVYDTCREFGAIVATGHEHSYARTHLMSNFERQQIVSTSNVLEIKPQNSFCFCSGLGGYSIRPWRFGLEQNPWWAATASESNGVADGALLCTFNVNGRREFANCFFQDTNGRVWDTFDIVSGNNATAPTAPNPSTKTGNSEFFEITTKTSTNDIVELSSGELSCNNPVLTTGEEKIALRFPDVPLQTRDAFLLNGVHLQVLGAAEAKSDEATRIIIRAELTADSQPFACGNSVAEQVSERRVTSAFAVWDNVEAGDDWETGEVWVSTDISPVIREVISQPGWKSGNAITLIIESEGSHRSFFTSDESACFAPTLSVSLKGFSELNLGSLKRV